MAGLCGIATQAHKPLDGFDLTGLLVGTRDVAPPRLILRTGMAKSDARDDRYMLDDVGHLYDLAADPGQTTDVRGKVRIKPID